MTRSLSGTDLQAEQLSGGPKACRRDRPPARAGSTLVEQILASHSLVEGTMELPVLTNMVRDLLRRRLISKPDAYPECITELNAFELADLGTHYLEECKAYRRTNRPCFIDKSTSNWLDAGLVRLVLPHAKIVDVRREPMAACFAMYKQSFKTERWRSWWKQPNQILCDHRSR
ncbi:MAG TPA: sulfotransferase [Rhizomicrobium sp.]|nr:sulfotransferase [Rhizomicrobium sp.]